MHLVKTNKFDKKIDELQVCYRKCSVILMNIFILVVKVCYLENTCAIYYTLCQNIQDKAKINWGYSRYSYFESVSRMDDFNKISKNSVSPFLSKYGLSKMASTKANKIKK